MQQLNKTELAETANQMKITDRKFHFVGAGGIGMSGLAALMMQNGAAVSGSDQTENEFVNGLRNRGAEIFTGHSDKYLADDIDEVVISAAIKEDNSELAEARRRGIEVRKYAQMLGEVMDRYEGIAVAGTHGKSTVCGWLVHLMSKAGLDPSFIVGAKVNELGNSWQVGTGRFFVAEACEYDRSFLNLKPSIGCILNIEQDHLDYYGDENEIIEAFEQFARGVSDEGLLIANGDDQRVRCVRDKLNDSIRCVTYGKDTSNDYHAADIALIDGLYSFDIMHGQTKLGRTSVSLPGRHNIMNALAVTAIAVEAGIDHQKVLALLPKFTGIERRLMLKAATTGVTVMDDYAHHPTEIRASLSAIRQFYNPGKLWCVFQPHQYSRTRFLLDDFAESFKLADVVILPEIYFVRDTLAARKQINSRVLVDRINANGSRAVFIDGFGSICDYLKENVHTGELIVTMGAGDVWKVADEYIQWLRRNS